MSGEGKPRSTLEAEGVLVMSGHRIELREDKHGHILPLDSVLRAFEGKRVRIVVEDRSG